ncbi:Histone-lysine N-methyltransferase SETMAR, partial [Ooceraea biroi]
YGEDALKLRQCQNWFTKFRSGDFNVKDAPRSGRPIEIDDDKIKALIDSNRRLTTREIAENLNISKSSVENHSKRLGYISKLDISVPHELKEIHLTKRIDICDSLLKPEENDPFLKRMITGDEKSIVYNNVKRNFTFVISRHSFAAHYIKFQLNALCMIIHQHSEPMTGSFYPPWMTSSY